MDIGHFFPKSGHFLKIFHKGQGRPHPFTSSSYAPAPRNKSENQRGPDAFRRHWQITNSIKSVKGLCSVNLSFRNSHTFSSVLLKWYYDELNYFLWTEAVSQRYSVKKVFLKFRKIHNTFFYRTISVAACLWKNRKLCREKRWREITISFCKKLLNLLFI